MSSQMASTKETITATPQPAGMELAVPALDAEILTAVCALNRYPQRTKNQHTLNDNAKAENQLAKRIWEIWLDLLPSTRKWLEALYKCGEEKLKHNALHKLLEELRNFGRKPVRYKKAATPAQEHESSLAQKFYRYKDNLSSSQIQELKAIWASNSGDKHPVVTKAGGSG